MGNLNSNNKYNIVFKNCNKNQTQSYIINEIFKNEGNKSNKSYHKYTLSKNDKTFNLRLIDLNKKMKYTDKHYEKANCIILELYLNNSNDFEDLKYIWTNEIKNIQHPNLVYLIIENINSKENNNDIISRIKKYVESEKLKYYCIDDNANDRIKSILDNIVTELEKYPNNISKEISSDIMPSKEEYKVIFVGDTYYSCKTTLIHTILQGKFPDFMDSKTYSNNGLFIPKKIELKNGKTITLDLWDIIGQEKYLSLAKIMMKGFDCVVFGYSITCKTSFNNVKDIWYKMALEVGKPKLMYLIGNHYDLYLKQEVNTEEATKFADEYNMRFFEVSCLKYYNIKEFFEDLVNEIVKI